MPFLSDTAAHAPQTRMIREQTYVVTHQLLFICILHNHLLLAETRNYHLYQTIETLPCLSLLFTFQVHIRHFSWKTFLVSNWEALFQIDLALKADLHLMPSGIYFCQLCVCEVVCSGTLLIASVVGVEVYNVFMPYVHCYCFWGGRLLSYPLCFALQSIRS